MNKGVYVHIPFCKNICSYCDFCKVLYKKEWVMPYLKKLNKEIKDIYMDDIVDTIYIGGGTPSSLTKEELEILFKVLSRLKKDLVEFTFECNLNDINEELLSILKENGVTRLSIGIETFDEELQKIIHRNHSFEEAKMRIDLCRAYDFNNINLDLMYGFKDEDLKMLKKDLKLFMKLNPEHISTYSLILEDSTILKNNNYENCDEELEVEMYEYICKFLKKHNFNHYEVSNFSKVGYESKHNLKYWNNYEYYGFGLGASGYIDGVRYNNTRSLKQYIENEEFSTKELLTEKDIMDNEIMLGFRKIRGINLEEFKKKYNVSMDKVYPIVPLIKNEDLIIKNGYIFINPDKIYVMNEILIKMV
ncbi:MAG: radical SAM family heme chaperone HemW [Firmicutes bacterium]|nr:radical SAM family heme chaperone HemW [Bacillota bacterium]